MNFTEVLEGGGTWQLSISSIGKEFGRRYEKTNIKHATLPSEASCICANGYIALNVIQGLIKLVLKIFIFPFEHNAVTRVLHSFEKQ